MNAPAPSHRLTKPRGEKLPPLLSPMLRLLDVYDWFALIDGHVTPEMARVQAVLSQPIRKAPRRARVVRS